MHIKHLLHSFYTLIMYHIQFCYIHDYIKIYPTTIQEISTH